MAQIDPITGLPSRAQNILPRTPASPRQGGRFEYPDYNALLTQWLAPYQQQYDANTNAGLGFHNADLAQGLERFRSGSTSTMDRIEGVHTDNLKNITDSLAARGMLRSGETKYLTDRENLAHKRNVYDATNQYQDWVKNLERAFASAQQGQLEGLQQQKLGLADILAGMYQPTWVDDARFQPQSRRPWEGGVEQPWGAGRTRG